MKKLAKRVFNEIPPFCWLAQRLQRDEKLAYDTYIEMRLLSAEARAQRFEAELNDLIFLLKPMRVVGADKIRIGTMADGGYVMLDDFKSVSRAYSLGIAGNVEWDIEMANRGIPVEQFDYSVTKSPVANPLFKFHQKKIESFADLMTKRDEGRQILKIDIEGSEWNFFDQATSENLNIFSQIVGEFHDFDLYHRPDWYRRTTGALRKINQTHQLVHLHGNNYGPTFWAGDFEFPMAFELSYVRRSDHPFEETQENFPGALDVPNCPGTPDYNLDKLVSRSESLKTS